MNLEDFFVSEYEKLRRENELLKEENANLNRRILKIPKPVETAGLIDARVIGTDVEAVKVSCATSWMIQNNCFKGKPSSYLEAKKADVANAEEWLTDGGLKPLDVKRESFAALIAVRVLGKERKYLVRDNCSLEWLNDPKLGTWCLAEQKAELVKKAKKALLEEMDITIERVKKEEASRYAESACAGL